MGNKQSIEYDTIDSIPDKELGNLAYALQIKNPRKLNGPNRKKVVNCVLEILNNDGRIRDAKDCLDDFSGDYGGMLDKDSLRRGRRAQGEKCSNQHTQNGDDVRFFSHRQFVMMKDGPDSMWCIDRSEELEKILQTKVNPYNGKSLTEKELVYLQSQRGKRGQKNIPYFDAVAIEAEKYKNKPKPRKSLAKMTRSPSLPKSHSQVSVRYQEVEDLPRYPIKKYLKEMTKYDTDNYENMKEIGEGSFGVVYRAERKKDGKTVVIKKISKDVEETMRDTMMIGPLPKEYVIMRGLDHPNILKVYNLEEDDKNFYMVTDYYSGGDLHSFMDDYDNLSLEMALHFTKQLLDALEYCHDRSIVHRDIKLENILVDKSGDMKIALADFGFATIQEPDDPLLDDYPGSPAFAAPELMQGIPYRGEKSDIWAVGVCMYMMITGSYPFWSDDRREMFNQITKGDFMQSLENEDKKMYEKVSGTPCMNLIGLLLTKDYRKRPSISEIKQSDCYKDDE